MSVIALLLCTIQHFCLHPVKLRPFAHISGRNSHNENRSKPPFGNIINSCVIFSLCIRSERFVICKITTLSLLIQVYFNLSFTQFENGKLR